MSTYITETPAPSSPNVRFLTAEGKCVAVWLPRGNDGDGRAVMPDGSTFALTLPEIRAELGAFDYVLTDEFPPDVPPADISALSIPCAYVLDGHDTDGTPWHRCTTHDELAPSAEAPCAKG